MADGTNGGLASNYALPTLNRTNAPVTINARTVGLSASKEYDGNTSLSGKVTITTDVGSETLTYTGAAANDANVATTNKFISAITLANGTGGLASNYVLPTLNAANAPVTITAKALTITANNDSKTYGDVKTYGSGSTAFTSSGLVNSQTIGSVTITDTNSGGVNTASAGGTYALTPSLATGGTFSASNYDITYTAGALTVNKKALTITANNDSKTYGDVKSYGSGSTAFASSGLVNSETIGSVTITDTNSGGVNTGGGGGTYALTQSLATGGAFKPSN